MRRAYGLFLQDHARAARFIETDYNENELENLTRFFARLSSRTNLYLMIMTALVFGEPTGR
jgi:hypothetical protein